MEPSGSTSDLVAAIFPEAGPELLVLLRAGAENAGLVASDFYTLRDLVELSGYADRDSLAALLLTMLVALDEGSLCVEASEAGMLRRLTDLVEAEQAAQWARRIIVDLPHFTELIGADAGEPKPVIRHSVGAGDFLYFQKYLRHDLIFREELGRRLRQESGAAGAMHQAALREALVQRPLMMDGAPLRLDARQQAAVELGLTRNFAVVSGGPGTGKTSIVLTLVRCLTRLGVAPERIALAAPTGRAAQRLSDALRAGLALLTAPRAAEDEILADLPAHTLHRLLRYHPERGTFGRHRENPVPADVVIVDEVSMVGVELMSRLLQALAPTTRLVLLGDKDQLPSVDAGAVLGTLVSDMGAAGPSADSLVILQENYRSQPRIREAARAINEQDAGVAERLPVFDPASRTFADLEREGGCWLLPTPDSPFHWWRATLDHWAEQQFGHRHGGQGSYQELVNRLGQVDGLGQIDGSGQQAALDRLFAVMNGARILTLLREGPWGCVEINRFLAQTLGPRWDRAARGGLFAGAPVLITRNDLDRQLSNGDVGIALRDARGGLRVVFPRPDGHLSLPADALPSHELGFALTVHKSQGSEYGQIMLVLPASGGRRLLTKEIIYTGITRAKNLALIVGPRDALRFAVARRICRESASSSEARPEDRAATQTGAVTSV